MAPRNPFGVRLPEELEEELAAFAERQGKSVSAVCRDLMQSGLDDQPGFLRRKLSQSLGRVRILLLRAEEDEIVEDVDELLEELEDLEVELAEEHGSEHDSDEDGQKEPEDEPQ